MKVSVRFIRVAGVLLGLFAAPGAWACDCMLMPPDQFAIKAALLFEGRLLRNEPLRSTPDALKQQVFPGMVEGVFQVDDPYKGDLGSQVRIRYWPAGGGNCGMQIRPYEKMTIAAYGDPESGYETNMCFSADYEPFRTQVLEAVRRQPQQPNAGTQSE